MYSSLVSGMYNFTPLGATMLCIFHNCKDIYYFPVPGCVFLPGVESILSVGGGGVCITYFPQYCLCLAIWVELRAKNNCTNTFRDNHFHHIANVIMFVQFTSQSTNAISENEKCLCLHKELTHKSMRAKQFWIIFCSGNRFRPFFALMIMRHFFSPHNGVKVNIDSLLISDWLMGATPSEIWDGRGWAEPYRHVYLL